MRKKSIEELQAELALESEALATLQIIYAEKVKQIRTNTSLPPDIQARFLSEWETFYQQRVASIFRKEYLNKGQSGPINRPSGQSPAMINMPAPPSVPPPPPPQPAKRAASEEVPPLAASAAAAVETTNDDILGVNTDSWMNAAESLTYEQYNDNEPIGASLMDSDKVQAPDESLSGSYPEESDSIDGYAATSGLKGLTEFMDFDLKRKKS